jgi:hypothetical protein
VTHDEGPAQDRATTVRDIPAVSIAHNSAYERGYLDGWLAHGAYQVRAGLTFDAGVAHGHVVGYAAASRAVSNAISEACQGIPYDAAEVIRRLVHSWDHAELRRQADGVDA